MRRRRPDAEDACSLNTVAGNDAEDPRVAAGHADAGDPDRPVGRHASEDVGGHHAIFVSRLVGGDHFELFNGGNPISGPNEDAGTPDITFFGNTPYVSWTTGSGDREARLRRAISTPTGSSCRTRRAASA